MPKKKVNEVLTIYSTCFKICKNCSNIQCNSCKKKTKAAFSNVSKVHYGLDISESEITLENLPSSHSGEKSNKCNQCDFASSYASALRAHLKTHSGEKPNKCNQCDFASSQAGNLRVHLKTHSREKPNIYQSNLPSLPTYLTFLPEKPTCFNSVSQAVRCFCQL